VASAPEVPPAKDPFEKRVALTIAIIAICNSFVANLGDNAKTASILRTGKATDQWGYFQAKSTKAQLAAMHGDLLTRLSSEERGDDTMTQAIRLGQEARRYDAEKADIKTTAEGFEAQAEHYTKINDRCDLSSLLLQIAVVICSVAILAQSHKSWWLGIGLGVAGVVMGGIAFFT
jgi:uncharacterized protein DUF4337